LGSGDKESFITLGPNSKLTLTKALPEFSSPEHEIKKTQKSHHKRYRYLTKKHTKIYYTGHINNGVSHHFFAHFPISHLSISLFFLFVINIDTLLCYHKTRQEEIDCCEPFCMSGIKVIDVFETIKNNYE